MSSPKKKGALDETNMLQSLSLITLQINGTLPPPVFCCPGRNHRGPDQCLSDGH